MSVSKCCPYRIKKTNKSLNLNLIISFSMKNSAQSIKFNKTTIGLKI